MRTSAILCLVVFAASCSSDTVPFGPGAFTDTVGGGSDAQVDGGIDDAGTADVSDVGIDVPVLSDCETNGDCVGGEVCREGLCREVCTVDIGCSGLLPVCDLTSGLCVQCVTSGDCEDGICEQNLCMPVECTEARDCAGGFTCSEGRCIPLEPPCAEGDLRCNGTAVQVCADGVFTVLESCAPRSCENSPEGPRCEAEVCAPSTTRCAGELLSVCNETGTEESTVSCDAIASCVGDEGCVCSDGNCEPRICASGARRCEGDEVLQCSADGLSETSVTRCGAGQTCASGACIDDACTFGESRCDGDALLTCGVDGRWARTDCASTGAVCSTVGSGAACVEPLCTPRSRRCGAATREVFVCAESGLSERREDCSVGEYCLDGTCLPQQCTPFARYCEDDNVLTCRANGSGGDVSERCDADELCLDGRCVTDDMCTGSADCPRPQAFCEGRVLVSFSGNGACNGGACDYNGVENTRNCDASGQACLEGPPARCGESTCETSADCGVDYCVGGTCVECRNRADCGGGEFCSANVCEDCGCGSNETCGIDGECVSGDADDCSSNSQCAAIAAALGYTGENAACGANGECYVMGRCGVDLLGGGDVFARGCNGALTCSPVIDLLGGAIFNSCGPCEFDSDCRAGETCLTDIIVGQYCGGPGDGGGGFLP